MNKINSFSIAALLTLSLASCGDSDGDSNSRVVNAELSDNVIQVGESSVFRMGLEYSGRSGLFNNPDDISLVVLVPAGLSYKNGTAEIQRSIEDKGVDPVVTNCATGEQYLDFRLDGDDLVQGSDPSGSADVEVSLTIEATSPVGIAILQATADRNQPLFSCGSLFAGDVEESIQIVP